MGQGTDNNAPDFLASRRLGFAFSSRGQLAEAGIVLRLQSLWFGIVLFDKVCDRPNQGLDVVARGPVIGWLAGVVAEAVTWGHYE